VRDGRVVVIGGGVGGLTSAALLATHGYDVTLVEAAAVPGGKLRAVVVDGVPVDGGPTVFTMRDVFDALFAECGSALQDHLTLRPATTLARHAWGESRLDLFADAGRSEAAIGDFAGAAEARGYRAFRAEARRLFDALDQPYMRSGKTDPITLGWRMGLRGVPDYLRPRAFSSLWRALGGYFLDPRLRQLFARYATYSGSSPFACPATLMLIAHAEASGVWFVEGGMHRLALALEALGRGVGVRFRYGAPVAEVLVERGRVAGVMLADGERIAAASVVCNADPAAIAAGALGAAARRAVRPMPPRRRSLSALVWTARAKTSGFPLAHHNVFFSDDYPAEFAALAAGRQVEVPTVYVCAQDRRDDLADPTGAERLQILVNAPATGDGAPLSPAEIETCRQHMLNSLSRAGLSVDPTGTAVLTTPSDFDRMFPSTGGALYGPVSHGWAASFRRQAGRRSLGSTARAGARTPARASRWRRFPAG
jgi:1-hydroxycarotenoid 3,4-desaturase